MRGFEFFLPQAESMLGTAPCSATPGTVRGLTYGQSFSFLDFITRGFDILAEDLGF
jgi:hypothetical protein